MKSKKLKKLKDISPTIWNSFWSIRKKVYSPLTSQTVETVNFLNFFNFQIKVNQYDSISKHYHGQYKRYARHGKGL